MEKVEWEREAGEQRMPRLREGCEQTVDEKAEAPAAWECVAL